MENIKKEIIEILNLVFEEKDNFLCENNYLLICNNLKDLIPLIEKNTYYKEYINEKGNRMYIEASRKSLIKKNKKLFDKIKELEKK
jgi:hypothetical protein